MALLDDKPAATVSLVGTAPGIHRSKTAELHNHDSDGGANETRMRISVSEAPVSPLVAASTTGEQYPANRLSYAHRRSMSGWNRLLDNMSQRAETHADQHNHENDADSSNRAELELRVPGIGEDSLAYGDVQYVYDEHYPEHPEDEFGRKLNGLRSNSSSNYDSLSVPDTHAANRRGRSNTGVSSTGSGLHFDHNPVTSTTALSPTCELPEADDEADMGVHKKPEHDHAAAGSRSSSHHLAATYGDYLRPAASRGGSSIFGRLFSHGASSDRSIHMLGGPDDHQADDEAAADHDVDHDADHDADHEAGGAGAENGDGEDPAIKRKKMEDLRHKLKRAVIKASVMTRKPPNRQMKSAMPSSMFPFLQDAMFVPMFHFMRDEHGHRAPPVIFDAIRLSVTVSGALTAAEEESHHFVVRIELQYGDVKWVIYRRLNDFLSLHTMLTLRRFQGRVNQLPAFPQQISYALERARSFKPGHHHRDGRMLQATAERKQALETYLIRLLRALNMRPAYDVCTFLELSAVSIVKDVGWKGKEGNLDRRVEHTTGMWCTPHDLRRWSRQWVLVRDSYIAFCNHISDPYPSDVLFADPQFDIKFRKKSGRNPLFPYRITVSNQYRRIQLRSDSERVINEWRHSITEMKNSSAWAVPHRFASFAPIRDSSRVIWFVDGDDYFYAVSEALENATDCIYIEDWWLSPEIHLRRPYHLNEQYRLDRLLKRKAEEGIKIYVVIYKEVTVSLSINSSYTKRKLQSLHPNIMVQRHPDHLAGGTMFWAHHEKMVIVDNTFAFIGGLDLCWGRYDTHGHRLADYYLPHNGKSFGHLQIFFGQDYNNARIHDFANVNDYEHTLINRCTTPRMPWHDVHMAMIGQPARDVARHFIQRWNFIKSSKGMAKPRLPFLMPKGEYSVSRNDLQYRGTCRTQVLRSSAEWSMGITKESSVHTAYCEMIRDAKHFIYIENQFFISNARDDPSYTIKNRIAEALVDRVKRAHRRQEKFRVIVLMPLMPAFEGDVNAAGAATLKLVMHWQYQAICRGDHSIAAQLEKEGINMHDYIRFFGLRTFDVIRRYADGAICRDTAGNAPQEVPDFDKTLLEHGVLPIDRNNDERQQHPPEAHSQPPPLLPSQQPAKANVPKTVNLPTPTPLGEAGQSLSTPARPANGMVPGTPSLSFGGPSLPQPPTNDYSFQRPDEAFANDSFPMQDNISRYSHELSRRSQDLSRRSHDQPAKKSSRPNLIGRHSFNLTRNPISRQRSSFSGIRTFLTGDKPGQRVSPPSDPPLSPAASDSEAEDDGSRRRNAFRYLVRGTEHIKQYGKQRRPGNQQQPKSAGLRLQKRLHKYGLADEQERRDSDSEFGGSSGMHLDLADVENYEHPPRADEGRRQPAHAAFLGGQEGGRPAERMQHTVLPEFAGAEYLREVLSADGMGDAGGAVCGPATVGRHARGKSTASRGNTRLTRQSDATTTATQQPAQASAAPPAYPPPAPARRGPQVLEHEVFGSASRTMQPPPPLISQPTAPAALASGELAVPRVSITDAGNSLELVHVEADVVDQVVTELVYIHCKLMIVDDRYVIMGSANINDRSMVGNRDSEIAMVVEDTEPVVTTMNGRPYQAAKFAHSLRVQLCQEHCGLLDSCDQMRYVFEAFAGRPPIDTQRSAEEQEFSQRAKQIVEDPLSEEFANYWWSTATTNEEAFRDVFRCVPDDTVETFDQYKKFIPGHEVPHGHAVPGRTAAESLERLKVVRGHLVPIPLNFLKNENLGAKLGDKELLVPVEVFT
ncbi:hypothetical protein GGI02_001697 [Coemansia sp. RSA 2322]|nr:hypothetical protein GGI02_001697 [Coemansia sp. RSA 2322]